MDRIGANWTEWDRNGLLRSNPMAKQPVIFIFLKICIPPNLKLPSACIKLSHTFVIILKKMVFNYLYNCDYV